MVWRRLLIAIAGVLACVAVIHPSAASSKPGTLERPSTYAVPASESPVVQAPAPDRVSAVGRDGERLGFTLVLVVVFMLLAGRRGAHAVSSGVDLLHRGWRPVVSPRGSPPLRRGPPS
jgi:hypothetical protein